MPEYACVVVVFRRNPGKAWLSIQMDNHGVTSWLLFTGKYYNEKLLLNNSELQASYHTLVFLHYSCVGGWEYLSFPSSAAARILPDIVFLQTTSANTDDASHPQPSFWLGCKSLLIIDSHKAPKHYKNMVAGGLRLEQLGWYPQWTIHQLQDPCGVSLSWVPQQGHPQDGKKEGVEWLFEYVWSREWHY